MKKFLLAMLLAGFATTVSAQDTDILKVGDKAPDFELESLNDQTVKLSDRLGKKPVILLFSRANW